MRTLAFAIATIFALNTGVALAADPPKAPAKTEAANKKKAPKKNADAKKTPAPAPAAKK